MQFKKYNAPYISHPDNSRIFMINVIISLLIIYVISFYFYGPRALMLGSISVLTAVATEFAILFIMRKKINLHDLSSVVTGMLIPLMMPASVPFRVPVVAAIFAIAVVKQPFGGTGNNVFNPAAAGYAFAISCFSSDIMFRYPQPLNILPIFDLSTVSLHTSNAFALSINGVPGYSKLTILLGNIPGPMGVTNILVLLACMLFLLYRRTISWQIPVTFLATTGLFAMLFRRIPASALDSAFYELSSGFILFGAIFMLADPVTIPKRTIAKIAYAFVCGIIVMIFRYIGRVQESFMFSILLMNATVWAFDTLFEKLAAQKRRKHFENIPNS